MNSSMDFKTYYAIFRDISKVVHSSTDLTEVMELVVWKSTKVLGAKGAILRILNLATDKLELFAAYGLSEKYLAKGPVFSHKIITDLCRENKVIVIDDILADPRIMYPDEALEEGIRMVLDVPLTLKDDIIGIIRVCFEEPREFSSEELDFVVAVGEQCACAIDKARLIEEQRAQYQQLSSHTEKLSALCRMAAGIAHEINNPLGGILLFSTNMRKKVPDEGPLAEGLDVIIRETQRCKVIIQDLLEFSRDREPVVVLANINHIINKAVRVLDNEFRLHHIQVEKDLYSKMPDTLLDPNQLQQVFVNLLINAVEAIQENGVISIRSRMSSDQDSQRIEIKDTGCGIAQDDMPTIFEPFFSTKTNGTGLGLSVSYAIVQKHEGNIQVRSEPGHGTRFTVDIPLRQ